MHGNCIGVSKEMRLVFGKGAANKHAHIFPHNRMLRYASILQRFKRALEQKPLLWIHRDGLFLCEPKEWSVESGEVDIEEIAACRIQAATLARVGVMEDIAVESLLWDFGPACAGASAEFPELCRCRHIARQATGHAYDGNRHCFVGRISRGVRVRAMSISGHAVAMTIDAIAVAVNIAIAEPVRVVAAIELPVGVAVSVAIGTSICVTIVEAIGMYAGAGLGTAAGKITMKPVAVWAGVRAVRCDSNGCHCGRLCGFKDSFGSTANAAETREWLEAWQIQKSRQHMRREAM